MKFDLKEIKELRKKYKLTQEELAKKANVSQTLITKIEAGKIDPTYSNAQKILEAIEELKEGKSFKEVGGEDMRTHEHWIDKDMPYGPSLGGLEKLPDEVFELDVNEHSEVIEGKDGVYLLIHVDEKEPSKYRPFEEVKDSVEFAATRKAKEDALEALILDTFAKENDVIYEDRVTKGMKKQ